MNRTSILLTAAVTGILAGLVAGCNDDRSSGSSPSTGASAPADKHDCKTLNACKGQGNCKTEAHACKGQNACKGQGGCKSS